MSMMRHPSGEQWPFGREPHEAFGELCLDLSRLLGWLTFVVLLLHSQYWGTPVRGFFASNRPGAMRMYHSHHLSGDLLTDMTRLSVVAVALGLCWAAVRIVRKSALSARGAALLAACVLALPFLPPGDEGATFRLEAIILGAAGVFRLIAHALGAKDYAA